MKKAYFSTNTRYMSKKEKLLLRLLSGNADAKFDLDDLVKCKSKSYQVKQVRTFLVTNQLLSDDE